MSYDISMLKHTKLQHCFTNKRVWGEPPVSLQSPGVLLPFALRKKCCLAACLLMALLSPLPPALLLPQPALLQQGAKSESAPT